MVSWRDMTPRMSFILSLVQATPMMWPLIPVISSFVSVRSMRKLSRSDSIVLRLHLAPRFSGFEYTINCCCARRERNVADETRLIVPRT